MQSSTEPVTARVAGTLTLAREALRAWGSRQVLVAIVAAIGTALVIGLATVLIPNSIFGREIPPVWWDYPVWLLASLLSGVLIATYVDPGPATAPADGVAGGPGSTDPADGGLDPRLDRRTSRMGAAGGVLAWFAVGCPVCNKIALVALGYSGAMSWFAPMQPFLAVIAIALTSVAIVWRLKGQMVCSIRPATQREPAPSNA